MKNDHFVGQLIMNDFGRLGMILAELDDVYAGQKLYKTEWYLTSDDEDREKESFINSMWEDRLNGYINNYQNFRKPKHESRGKR